MVGQAAVQAPVEALIVSQDAAGRPLRGLAELTDRSFSAVRNILTRHGIHRRGTEAALLRGSGSPTAGPTKPMQPGVSGCNGEGVLRSRVQVRR